MTETEMSCELTMAFSDFRQNSVLASIVSGCLAELGAPEWTEADYALAKKFLSSYDAHTREEMRRDLEQRFGEPAAWKMLRQPLHSAVIPYDRAAGGPKGGSTDVGDVSYVVPTVELHVASEAIGTVGHSWQDRQVLRLDTGDCSTPQKCLRSPASAQWSSRWLQKQQSGSAERGAEGITAVPCRIS